MVSSLNRNEKDRAYRQRLRLCVRQATLASCAFSSQAWQQLVSRKKPRKLDIRMGLHTTTISTGKHWNDSWLGSSVQCHGRRCTRDLSSQPGGSFIVRSHHGGAGDQSSTNAGADQTLRDTSAGCISSATVDSIANESYALFLEPRRELKSMRYTVPVHRGNVQYHREACGHIMTRPRENAEG